MTKRRVEFSGRVHLVTPLQGEHTLCGVAADAADSERDESLRWQRTPQVTVTCPQCVAVIEHCRHVPTLALKGTP